MHVSKRLGQFFIAE